MMLHYLALSCTILHYPANLNGWRGPPGARVQARVLEYLERSKTTVWDALRVLRLSRVRKNEVRARRPPKSPLSGRSSRRQPAPAQLPPRSRPVSTGEGTRRVQLVRGRDETCPVSTGGGGGHRTREPGSACSVPSQCEPCGERQPSGRIVMPRPPRPGRACREVDGEVAPRVADPAAAADQEAEAQGEAPPQEGTRLPAPPRPTPRRCATASSCRAAPLTRRAAPAGRSRRRGQEGPLALGLPQVALRVPRGSLCVAQAAIGLSSAQGALLPTASAAAARAPVRGQPRRARLGQGSPAAVPAMRHLTAGVLRPGEGPVPHKKVSACQGRVMRRSRLDDFRRAFALRPEQETHGRRAAQPQGRSGLLCGLSSTTGAPCLVLRGGACSAGTPAGPALPQFIALHFVCRLAQPTTTFASSTPASAPASLRAAAAPAVLAPSCAFFESTR
jgi:hypothetical protein